MKPFPFRSPRGFRSPRTPRRRKACGDSALIEAVSCHVERYVGGIDCVFHETDSELVHLDVHHVPPSEARPFHALVTSGMAELAMRAPETDATCYAELFLILPQEWRLDSGALRKDRWSWPVRVLRDLARFPHEQGTVFGCGDTVQNGVPCVPYASSVRFCGALLAHPVSLGMGFAQLKLGDRWIVFLQVVPLFAEELRFAQEHSSDALVARFAQYRLSDVADPGRQNVCDLTVH